MVDLVNFWTGASTLPTGNDSLLVKFDAGSSTLPLAETCFRTIVLATEHSTYDEFRKNMDIALKFGSKGFSFTWVLIFKVKINDRLLSLKFDV